MKAGDTESGSHRGHGLKSSASSQPVTKARWLDTLSSPGRQALCGVRWRDPDSAQRIRSRYDAFVITVIFACVHNAGRSQMAAAIFNAFADPEIARAVSAGTHPAERVHPEVVQVMHEVGVDLSGATPRGLSDGITREANWLITMGCGEQCPVIPGVRRDDWPIDDPKGKPLAEVRRIREDIELRVRSLLWLINA